MKFIHIADVHLGAKPDRQFKWSDEREKERYDSFQAIIKKCNDEEIDLLLIAGDLFSKQPLIRELKEVNYLFEALHKTRVLLIAGNHDFIGLRSNYTNFKWSDKVHFFYEEEFTSIYIEELNTEVYGFSYHSRELHEAKFHTIKPSHKDRINILLVHGGSVNHSPMDKAKMLESDFDYIAMGHIHKPQIFENKMAYSGSLEPMDKTETGPRGHIVGEITRENERIRVELEFVVSALRQYKKLELEVNKDTTMGSLMDMVKERIQKEGIHDIYILDLIGKRDPDILFTMDNLYQLGNVIEVNNYTEPDYDFNALYKENSNNIIGYYMKQIESISTEEEELLHRALYLGIEALLGAKN